MSNILVVYSITAVLILLSMAGWFSFAFADKGSYDLVIDDRTFTIEYDTLTGSQISKVSAQHGSMSLTIELEGVVEDGIFTLTFPRDLLDHIFTGHETVIFMDEMEASYKIVESSCEDVTMQLYSQSGTEEIIFAGSDLPGTHIHPQPQIFQPPVQINSVEGNFELFPELDSKMCGYLFDPDAKRIHFDLEHASTNDIGNFVIVLPHNILGGNYTVLVDGKVIPHSEEFISASRIFPASVHDQTRIWFDYDTDARNIDILGQTAMPEFGSLTMTGIVISMASLIIFGKVYLRNR